MAATGRVSIELTATYTGTADHGAPLSNPKYARQLDFSSGTGAGKIDKVWSDKRTIAASSSEELDLAGGLTDVYGGTVTLATVKMLAIVASSANTNDVVVGAASENAWDALLGDSGTLTLKPGQFFVTGLPSAAGMGVTASTADLLKVANSSSGSSVTYDIFLYGATATS
jgi:hypothetical protein